MTTPTTEDIIFESRKSVFKVTLAYFVLTIIILAVGNFMALVQNDHNGLFVIGFGLSFAVILMGFAMYYQSLPLQIEVERLKKIEVKEDEDE